ncbi:MAG: methyltransferase type 11, partial [Candidatus Omnitrophica bacterium]|nr:methyltransferase type 11 [Candidatus Omnitrophota bacterium]
VCGNTAAMLEKTRYGKAFRITGDTSTHLGPFQRAVTAPRKQASGDVNKGGPCC